MPTDPATPPPDRPAHDAPAHDGSARDDRASTANEEPDPDAPGTSLLRPHADAVEPNEPA